MTDLKQIDAYRDGYDLSEASADYLRLLLHRFKELEAQFNWYVETDRYDASKWLVEEINVIRQRVYILCGFIP